MKAEWVDTRDFYHQIIAAPDQARREQLYRELFLTPWKPMMDLIGPMFQADPADDFSVARAWAWLLPDDLTAVPDSLRRLEAADAWRVGGEALAEAVARFARYADRIPFDTLSGWLVLADPRRAILSGGATPAGRTSPLPGSQRSSTRPTNSTCRACRGWWFTRCTT